MERRDNVRKALINLLIWSDDDKNPDEDITEEEAKEADELTDLVIDLWDALNG